jgi:hypothetical protein
MYPDPPTIRTVAGPECPPLLTVIRWMPRPGPTSETIRMKWPAAELVLT